MTSTVLAAQMYTVRDFLKTPADIAKSLARVKKIGYQAVQMSGHGKIAPGELAKILRGEGLICCSTHEELGRLGAEPSQVVAENEMWGCKYIAYGGSPTPPAGGPDCGTFIQTFNAVAKKYQGTGIRLGYHNHSHELTRYDGKTALQMLVDGLSSDIWMEIDTYWVQHGGGDPAAWIAKVPGRIPCVHLKDMTATAKREQLMAEVGEGNLNWPAILAACTKAGVEWYIVEQDYCQRDPFDSLAISLGNLKVMGLK